MIVTTTKQIELLSCTQTLPSQCKQTAHLGVHDQQANRPHPCTCIPQSDHSVQVLQVNVTEIEL